jgi:hypothetical protein
MSIRTTLTLDDDVASKLKQEMRRRELSFKEVVNQTLRLGLNTPRANQPLEKFRVTPKRLSAKSGFNLDNIGQVLDQLDYLERP